MELKAPGLFLCFDDRFIDEWHSYIKYFDDKNIKATFYVSDLARVINDPKRIDKLDELQAHGHTIGCHGLNHVRAGFTIDKVGWKTFYECDILPWLNIMKSYGFNNIQHYSYPMGNRTEESDRYLLSIFQTLRQGGRAVYPIEQIRKIRVIRGALYEKHSDMALSGLEHYFEHLIKQKAIGCVYTHHVLKPRLDWLASLKGLNFLPMSVLDKERG